MIRRFILAFVTAFLLTACGSGTDPVTIKRINSSNGVPLIEFTYTSQQALRSFLKIGELQVVDGTGFCKEVEGVTGTATVPPAAPLPGDVIVIAFADCVDENGITWNNSIRVTFTAFTDWSDLSFTLEVIDLTAEADWFDGIASLSGTLDYVVAGNAGSITSATFEAAVPTGTMGRLTLPSLEIVVTEDSDNPALTRTAFSGDGEIANTQIDTLNIRILAAFEQRHFNRIEL